MRNHIEYRPMAEEDISAVIPLYINHYNVYEGGEWTEETTYKRIHQVWSHEDSMCLIALHKQRIIGFSMGHFEQYDDLIAFDLVEIVIDHDLQNQGVGTAFMLELEHRVKEAGGSMIQLQAVNDAQHEAFYSKLEYKNCNNLVLKSKFL